MNWKEQVGLVIIVGALVMFVIWILDMLGLQERIGSEVSFLISGLYAFLFAIILKLGHIQKDLNETKAIVKVNGGILEVHKSRLDEHGALLSSKKGDLDMRVLFVFTVL